MHMGRHEQLVPQLRDLARQHPLREHNHAQLMLALYRCGRQAEALAAYQRARDVLVTELGVEPGPGLRDLHQRILSADPALAVTGPARPAEAEPLRVTPQELPSAVPGFTGRSAELKALTGLLDRSGPQAPGAVVISAIGGTAGVGKTALAVHWAHNVADRFPDGQLYVNLRGYDPGQPVPAADALAGFLRSLGVPGQDIPPEENERAARYRSLLAGKRILVVLDNAGSADQVRPLLPGTGACTVVVTSRDALAGLVAIDGAARLDLDLLPLAEAVALLQTLIGSRADAEPDAAAELADQCCRLPLALRVAAELAASRPAASLAGLTGELADLRTRLDLLGAGGDPRTQVRAVFSWSYQQLSIEAARAFRLVGLNPGPDLEPYAAAALTGAALPLARQALEVLARAHLISNTRGESDALVRLGEVYLGLGGYEQAAGHFEQALAMSREISARIVEADALNGLGEVHFRTGEAGKARAHHTVALRLASQAGVPLEQARAHSGLARACQADGNPLQARHHWQQALTHYAAIDAPEADEIRARLATAGDNGDNDRKPTEENGGTTALPRG
jgi:tetratricopeptide (TPR) repeat protein